MIDGKDYIKEELVIEKDLYNYLLEANIKGNTLNEYIYNNFFYELLNYNNITNDLLKKYIKSSYNTTSFLESNFINRWDFFITETGIKTTEINNDTPGGYVETVSLNELLKDQDLNPNKDFLNNFLNGIKLTLGDNKKGVFLLGSLSYREDYKLMLLVKDFLIENGIKAYIGLIEELNLEGDKVFYRGEEIFIIFRYYPIDRVYDSFDMSNIENLQNKGLFKVLNHQCSYVFQLKSYFSFLWENIEKFDESIKKIIVEIIPLSVRMDNINEIDLADILKNKNNWVLKDINNREGRGIYLGEEKDNYLWDNLVKRYIGNKNYILQEKLNIVKNNGYETNFGVYNINNNFSGIYIRVGNSKTNINSLVMPISIKK